MIKSNGSNSSLWRRIYTAWLASGKLKIDFYTEDFSRLWPANQPLPGLNSFYRRTRIAELELAQAPEKKPEAEAVPAQRPAVKDGAVHIRKVGRNFQIADADSGAVTRALGAQVVRPDNRASARSSPPLIQQAAVRMTLADGACIEFATSHPEELALQLYAISRRAA